MKNPESKVVATRVTVPLVKVIEKYLHLAAHVTVADFVRDAIREKLQRDVPELYRGMLQMEMKET